MVSSSFFWQDGAYYKSGSVNDSQELNDDFIKPVCDLIVLILFYRCLHFSIEISFL